MIGTLRHKCCKRESLSTEEATYDKIKDRIVAKPK